MKAEKEYLNNVINYNKNDYKIIKEEFQPLVHIEFLQSLHTGDYYVRVVGDGKIRSMEDYDNYDEAKFDYVRWVSL